MRGAKQCDRPRLEQHFLGKNPRPRTRKREDLGFSFVWALRRRSSGAVFSLYHTTGTFVNRKIIQIFFDQDPIICAKRRKYIKGVDKQGFWVYNKVTR
jgi:hypothetical protein